MNVDLNELRNLVDQIKADREAAKEREKRDAWTKYVSLTMVCLAVLTAVMTQRAGGYSSATLKNLNDATYFQANASDQWSYFQSKSIKQHLYEMERDRAANGASSNALEKMNARITKYETEKNDISKAAKELEEKRDRARQSANNTANRGSAMGLAITIFQVAVALGGICLVVKKRWLWFACMVTGGIALAQAIRVFTMPL